MFSEDFEITEVVIFCMSLNVAFFPCTSEAVFLDQTESIGRMNGRWLAEQHLCKRFHRIYKRLEFHILQPIYSEFKKSYFSWKYKPNLKNASLT